MISLLVAVLAFDISLRTYTSIDAVNSMTRMDGNIMENENYRTNLITLLKDFKYESIIESREAMIYFNKARVRFFSSAMNGQDSSVWKDYMNRAVISFIQKDDFKLLSAPFRQIVNYVS